MPTEGFSLPEIIKTIFLFENKDFLIIINIKYLFQKKKNIL